MIAAIGKNNELGKKNDLLWNLPADMKHFRETTRGHAVIMGQKTFESLGCDDTGKQVGRLLPNRRNIILTLDMNFKKEGAEITHSIQELLELLKNTTKEEEEVFIIGGGMIYKLFINISDKLYITHVNEEFNDAEIFFPAIDLNIWEETTREDYAKDTENMFDYSFVTYLKK